jgi:hypothetical protein
MMNRQSVCGTALTLLKHRLQHQKGPAVVASAVAVIRRPIDDEPYVVRK